MCDPDVELMLHVFFDCEFASRCWQLAGFHFDMLEVEYAPNWLLNKLETENHDTFVKIASVLWGIWFVRNKKIWEGKVVTPALAIGWSMNQINAWREAVKKFRAPYQNNTSSSGAIRVKEWQSPAAGGLKINVDAFIFPEADSFSIGMILRDHDGVFLGARMSRFPSKVSVLEPEAVGMREALVWASEFPGQPIIIESNAQLVISALQRQKQYHREVGIILEECQVVLSGWNNVQVAYVNRLANKAAHLLARLPCSSNSQIVYESPSQAVLETILYDSCKL